MRPALWTSGIFLHRSASFRGDDTEPGRELLLAEAGAVVGQEAGLPLGLRVEVHGAVPDLLEVDQGLARVVLAQVDAFVLVREDELAAVRVVPIRGDDDGAAEVGELEEERVLDLPELPALEGPGAALGLVAEGEELMAAAELLGEEGIDEG